MYLFSLLILISFAGFRYHLGGDTFGYIYRFYNNEYPSLESYSWEDFEFGKDPFFALLNSIVLYLGGKFFVFQFVHAAILNFLLFAYFKKHCECIFTCVFFYFIVCFFHYNTEILRGSLSIAICLFGNDYILKKQWIKGFILYYIALNFHLQTVLILITPLLFSMKFNQRGVVLLFLLFAIVFYFQSSLVDYVELFNLDDNLEKRSELYLTSEVYGSRKQITKGFIIGITPIIYVLAAVRYLKKHDQYFDLSSIESFTYIGVLFFLISIIVPIAYRYEDYYRVYFLIIYSKLFVVYSRKFRGKLGERFLRSFIIFIPLLLTISIRIWADERYFPYSDIFQKEIVIKRERLYNGIIRPDQY